MAFGDCRSLTSITIGNSVTSIGNYAFYYCQALTSIDIPNSVTSIGDRPFYSCSALISISVASDNPTYDSRGNCNAIIETSTNTLILGCKNTIIPNSVTSIGNSAFFNCRVLASITIPNSVTSIGNNAFMYCGLTTIDLPNSVTSIGNSAFSHCSSLISVTIGSGVTSIGANAFNYNALATVKCFCTVPPLMASYNCFSTAAYNSAKLLVPCDCETAYAAAAYWYKFAHIEEMVMDEMPGDVNGDGNVTIADVSALIDYLLCGDASGINLSAADCNQDSGVSISDVTSLIDYLLSGTWN